jgi:hypothetical protein
MKCPGLEKLITFLDGDLAADESARLTMHLASGCAACAANRDWYLQVRAIAASDNSVEPPVWVTRRALRIFENKRPSLLERLQNAVAALVFDSFATPQVAGARSTNTVNRQLLYRAGDFSVDLQITPTSENRAELTGQILRDGETAFESVKNSLVTLHRQGAEQIEAITSDMGEFNIPDLPQGDYTLSIKTHSGIVEIFAVPVRSE